MRYRVFCFLAVFRGSENNHTDSVALRGLFVLGLTTLRPNTIPWNFFGTVVAPSPSKHRAIKTKTGSNTVVLREGLCFSDHPIPHNDYRVRGVGRHHPRRPSSPRRPDCYPSCRYVVALQIRAVAALFVVVLDFAVGTAWINTHRNQCLSTRVSGLVTVHAVPRLRGNFLGCCALDVNISHNQGQKWQWCQVGASRCSGNG